MFKTLNTSALGISGNQSEIIELALTYGFQAMELDVVDFATRVKLRGMPYARRLIDSAKILISSFRLPFDWETDEDVFQKNLEKLGGYANAAAEVGCTSCLATVAAGGDVRPYHENFEFHRGRFAEICKALEPSGIRLGVGYRAAASLRKEKAFQFIHEQDALGLLLNMVDAPNIGMVLDIWDLVVSGGSIEGIRSIPVDQIVAVQLADLPEDAVPTEATEEARLLPGATGTIDSPAALAILAELGYDGPVAAKPHRSVLGTTRRDPIARRVGEALDAVWKSAGLTPQGTLAVAAES
jgi:sugar phosphate isomerase/epimerase